MTSTTIMYRGLFITMRVFALCAVLCVVAGDYTPKTYTVELDTAPENRWDEVCRDYNTSLRRVTLEIEKLLPLAVPKEQYAEAMALMEVSHSWLPEPFKGEITGLARCSGLLISEIMTLNFFYDFVSHGSIACTGIIANYKDAVLHGRNLDFGGGADLTTLLRNDTITVNYMKDGKVDVVYTGFFGLVGTWTGQRNGLFTVEGNKRNIGSLDADLQAIRDQVLPPSMRLRQALFNASSFMDAATTLRSVPLSAAVYYIIGGTQKNEGVILTRNNTDTEASKTDIWTIEDAYKWFLVQTNYDHWTTAGDDRRQTAVDGMNLIGSPANVTTDSLYKVMSTVPVMNGGTVFTTIMSGSDASLYRAVVREYTG